MEKVIPAQCEIYCDRCKCLCLDCDYKNKAVVKYDACIKNYMWEYTRMPTKKFDLCDNCFDEFRKFIGDLV